MNKKGYLMILEAVIAVVIIMLFIYTVVLPSARKKSGVESEVEMLQSLVLREIIYRDNFRECVVNYQSTDPTKAQCKVEIENFIRSTFPSNYESKLLVCPDECTVPDLPGKAVYMNSAFLAASLTQKNEKIVRIYSWRK